MGVWSCCTCLVAVVVCTLAAPSVPTGPGYRGYKLVSVVPTTETHMQILKGLADEDFELDFWTHAKLNTPTDIMVPPSRFQELKQKWTNAGMEFTVKQDDVQALIDKVESENERLKAGPVPMNTRTIFSHNQYYGYDTIVDQLKTFRNTYPNLVRFDETGSTPSRPRTEADGRIIHFIELGRYLDQRPILMYEVNIHAREHITAAANLYMMDWVLANYATNADAKYLLDSFHFVIIPVANPDGYEYSRLNSNNRLWRKNRKRITSTCTGVDLNRNFPEPSYSSSGSCLSDTYPGQFAASEAETQATINIFRAFSSRVAGYFPVHCYSQVLLTPWSSSPTGAKPPNGAEQDATANAMANAIRLSSGKVYIVGSAYATIGYNALGTSGDWALAEKPGIISIAYEMRPDRNASNGFVLPASEIIPTGQEYIASILAAAQRIVPRTAE